MSLGADVTAETRGECLQDYERGRAHLLFAFSLKLASYMEPPAVMLAAAHHRRGTSVHAIKVCLECDCQHPRIQRLKSHPLVDEANEYIEGEDLASLPNLSLFVAELRFGWSSERLVEGGHASVNLRAARSRNRTEAYDSLGLRLPELKQLLENDADALHVFLECLEQARTPKQLVETGCLCKYTTHRSWLL